jgi:SAM-dependent methyltransferase
VDADRAGELKLRAEREHGPWTAHNIHLGGGVYTLGDPVAGGSELRMRRAVQVVADLLPRPVETLRVADLGCLEGGFAVEFAQRGAEVVAIDGREANLGKVRVAQEALSLDRLEVVRDDVRNFGRAAYGQFDVILAFGIVYHLEISDTVALLGGIAAACRGLLFVDSDVAPVATDTETVEGVTYGGFWYREPTGEAHDRDVLWSAIGNERSFAPTRGSLVRALQQAGFTTVMECHVPPAEPDRLDRATFVAVRGERQLFSSCPPLDMAPDGEVPEFTLSAPEPGPKVARRRRFLPRRG